VAGRTLAPPKLPAPKPYCGKGKVLKKYWFRIEVQAARDDGSRRNFPPLSDALDDIGTNEVIASYTGNVVTDEITVNDLLWSK